MVVLHNVTQEFYDNLPGDTDDDGNFDFGTPGTLEQDAYFMAIGADRIKLDSIVIRDDEIMELITSGSISKIRYVWRKPKAFDYYEGVCPNSSYQYVRQCYDKKYNRGLNVFISYLFHGTDNAATPKAIRPIIYYLSDGRMFTSFLSHGVNNYIADDLYIIRQNDSTVTDYDLLRGKLSMTDNSGTKYTYPDNWGTSTTQVQHVYRKDTNIVLDIQLPSTSESLCEYNLSNISSRGYLGIGRKVGNLFGGQTNFKKLNDNSNKLCQVGLPTSKITTPNEDVYYTGGTAFFPLMEGSEKFVFKPASGSNAYKRALFSGKSTNSFSNYSDTMLRLKPSSTFRRYTNGVLFTPPFRDNVLTLYDVFYPNMKVNLTTFLMPYSDYVYAENTSIITPCLLDNGCGFGLSTNGDLHITAPYTSTLVNVNMKSDVLYVTSGNRVYVFNKYTQPFGKIVIHGTKTYNIKQNDYYNYDVTF